MAKHGKRYLEPRARRSTASSEYTPAEAVALVKEPKRAKFDESVEVHVRTGLNVRHADEQLRGTIALPARPRQGRHDRRLRQGRQGARGRGGRRRRRRRRGPRRAHRGRGFTDFDVAIATPDMMPVVGRLGRILGPQGKMPNPKVGTVTMDVAKAVEESKAGKVEYRTDRTAIVHLVDRQDDASTSAQLLENYAASSTSSSGPSRRRPRARYIRSITVASTMGPGIKVDPSQTKDILSEEARRAAA